MSMFTPTVTVVAVEVALLLVAAMVVQWSLRQRSHRRELKAMSDLVAELKSGDETRREQLQAYLSERLGVDPEQAPEAAAALVQQESTFYRYLVRTYLGRDHEALGRMRQNLGALLSAYQELLAGALAEQEILKDARAERDRLREQNETLTREHSVLAAEKAQLEEQMSITLNTVNQMLDEYSHLFGSADLPTKRLPDNSVLERVLSTIEVETTTKDTGA